MKKIKIETTFDVYDSVEDLAIPVQKLLMYRVIFCQMIKTR